MIRSSDHDLHQHGEDGERSGVGESDSDGCFDEHGFRLLIRGRGLGETRGRRELRASGRDVHQHDKNGQRRGVGESDSGGCFDEHGSNLLVQGRRYARGLLGAQLLRL